MTEVDHEIATEQRSVDDAVEVLLEAGVVVGLKIGIPNGLLIAGAGTLTLDHVVTGGWAAVMQGFAATLAADQTLVGDLAPPEAAELGAQAARDLLNGRRWSSAVGERWNTSTVTELLGVSRQALSKRLRNHSILGLVGTTTTWYPTWQFDRDRHEVQDVVRSVLGAFYDLDEDTDPLLIASWAQTPQPEELVGPDGAVHSPAQWISAGLDDLAVVDCARRTAARLAQ